MSHVYTGRILDYLNQGNDRRMPWVFTLLVLSFLTTECQVEAKQMKKSPIYETRGISSSSSFFLPCSATLLKSRYLTMDAPCYWLMQSVTHSKRHLTLEKLWYLMNQDHETFSTSKYDPKSLGKLWPLAQYFRSHKSLVSYELSGI